MTKSIQSPVDFFNSLRYDVNYINPNATSEQDRICKGKIKVHPNDTKNQFITVYPYHKNENGEFVFKSGLKKQPVNVSFMFSVKDVNPSTLPTEPE